MSNLTLKNNKKISITGMVGSGKSTLGRDLANYLSVPYMPEFDEGDEIFHTLLRWMLEGRKVELFFQLYFIESHKDRQNDFDDKSYMADTHLFSHFIFAHKNITDKSKLATYDMLFFDYVRQVKNPDHMIILDINYNTCIERMQKRGRQEEMDTMTEENLQYYRELTEAFKTQMPALCEMFGITYDIIKADHLTEEGVLLEALDILNNNDLLIDKTEQDINNNLRDYYNDGVL